MRTRFVLMFFSVLFLCGPDLTIAQSTVYGEQIFDPGLLTPIDSILKVKEGEKAPLFILPSIKGESIDLSG